MTEDPSEKNPNHKDHQKYSKMMKNHQSWEKNFKGPDYPGLGSEGFKKITLLFRIKRKIKQIFFIIDRELKFLVGVY